MALQKKYELFKIDSHPTTGAISVRVDEVVIEDDKELSRIPHRHTVLPYRSSKNSEGVWTHSNTDISGEDSKVQGIALALWTDEVKQAYKDQIESEI